MKIKRYIQCLSTTVYEAERPSLGLNSQFEALLFKDLPSGSDKKKHNHYLLHSPGLHTLPSLVNRHFSISLLILREDHHGIKKNIIEENCHHSPFALNYHKLLRILDKCFSPQN
uniref:Uncharacterized protein n=1 Tax=Theropithecus gelada TaxID=9565 RepID=A0A8D2FNR9_THEGE